MDGSLTDIQQVLYSEHLNCFLCNGLYCLRSAPRKAHSAGTLHRPCMADSDACTYRRRLSPPYRTRVVERQDFRGQRGRMWPRSIRVGVLSSRSSSIRGTFHHTSLRLAYSLQRISAQAGTPRLSKIARECLYAGKAPTWEYPTHSDTYMRVQVT